MPTKLQVARSSRAGGTYRSRSTHSANCRWSVRLGLSPKTGVVTPTVILAFVPEESKVEMTCHNCRIEMVKAGFYGKAGVQRFK